MSEPRTESARYRLTVTAQPEHKMAIRIFDCFRDRLVIERRGAIVRHLLESGRISVGQSRNACYTRDKHFVWHFILTCAAAQMALNRIHVSRHSVLADRLRSLQLRLGGLQKQIANLLFEHPGKHFSAGDVHCLLLLKSHLPPSDRVVSCLDELAEMGLIQRIEVDKDNVFYDIDTSPHLHLFDPLTRELRDARVQGLIELGSETLETRVKIVDGESLIIEPVAGNCG